MNRWRTIVTLFAAVALAYAAFAPVANTQPSGWLSYLVQDPQGIVQFRAMGAYGAPAMTGVGTAVPTQANSGLPPVNGEQFLVRDNAGANEPVVTFWSAVGAAWRSIPVSTFATNAPDVANSVWFSQGAVTYEGLTADANELDIEVSDVGQDTDIGIGDPGEIDASLILSLLDPGANDVDDAFAIWGGGTAADILIYEGATGGDANELMLSSFDPGADRTLYLPDVAEAAGSFVTSTVDAMDNDAADAVWMEASQIWFEGATGANAFETVLTVMDPTVGIDTYQFSDNALVADTYNVIFSLLDTNAINVGDSIWMDANTIIFEGATGANAFEIELEAADSTVGVDTYLFMDHALAADDYQVIGVPDVTQTTGNLFYGEYTDASAGAGNADNVLVVKRVYVPHAVTVIQVDTLSHPLASVSNGDNTIAVAIYYDDDAGAQIVELVNPTDDTGAAATELESLDIADTLLHPGWYRVAFCAQDATDNDLYVHQTHAEILLVQAAGAVSGEMSATATNPCNAGDPPATTGVLVQGADNPIFMLTVQ